MHTITATWLSPLHSPNTITATWLSPYSLPSWFFLTSWNIHNHSTNFSLTKITHVQVSLSHHPFFFRISFVTYQKNRKCTFELQSSGMWCHRTSALRLCQLFLPKVLVLTYVITSHNTSEDCKFNIYRCENLNLMRNLHTIRMYNITYSLRASG